MVEIVLVIVLAALLGALFVISFLKRKKFNAEMSQMRQDVKVGDKVMTDSGIIGEMVESFVEEEYTYFVLKTGKGENTGFVTVHSNSVCYAFGKEDARTEKKTTIVVPTEENKE